MDPSHLAVAAAVVVVLLAGLVAAAAALGANPKPWPDPPNRREPS